MFKYTDKKQLLTLYMQ